MAFLQEYTMLGELGRGGFATVYKVRHNELDYIRAVRVLNETVVDANSPTYRKFLRECKVLLRLGNGNHPNIVHIYQPRLLENKALVEMDYIDGLDIQHYLKQNQNFVPAEEVIRMALQMSSALAYCHEDIYRFCMDRDADDLQDDPNDGSKVLMDDQTRKWLIEKYKVIHNDIHSGNIMRREDGNFVLLDFGLAINGDEVVRSSRRKNGAPEFKAPEKWDNEAILTEQSDIYSFGVVLYQYLAGRVPFPFDTTNPNPTEAEYLLSKAHRDAVPPSIEECRKEFYEGKFEGQEYEKDYPQWLEDVILKCLNKNPKDRFRNGKELYEAVKSAVSQTHEIPQCGDQEEQSDSIETNPPINVRGKWGVFAILFLLVLIVWNVILMHRLANESTESPSGQWIGKKNKRDLIFTLDNVSFKMKFVKGGTFQMGSDSGEDDEKPVHSVTISDCYMGEFEVTQALWQEVMGTTVYQQRDKADVDWPMRGVGADYPMYYVSYTEAEEFCGRINQRLRSQLPDGYSFALPTEAEWEYAARGGRKSEAYTYSGSNYLSDAGWYEDNSGKDTHSVGLKKANKLGLYDMSGNVWEWCSDCYGPYSSSTQTDPRGSSSAPYRVLRGGSWNNSESYCRVANRGSNKPGSRFSYSGFRIALVRR